jgi:hypothetical protein
MAVVKDARNTPRKLNVLHKIESNQKQKKNESIRTIDLVSESKPL